GLTYLKSGQWDLAIADFTAALRLEPKLPTALYGRGYAKLKKGDAAGGKAEIAAAQTIQKKIETEYSGYGIHLEEEGIEVRTVQSAQSSKINPLAGCSPLCQAAPWPPNPRL